MTAPVSADRATGPRQPGMPWPDPVPHPAGPAGPRYPALVEAQAVARRVAANGGAYRG